MDLNRRFNERRPQIEMLALWLFSRALVFLMVGRYGTDIPLYREAARRMLEGQVPYLDFALDHPPLALLVMAVPALVESSIGYAAGFHVLMTLCDLGVFLALTKIVGGSSAHRDRLRSVLMLYIWMGAILFPFLYDRIDGVVTLLVVLLVWLGLKSRFVAGYGVLLLSLATNFGLWLLWPFWFLFDMWASDGWRGPAARFATAATVAVAGLLVGVQSFGDGFAGAMTYHWFRGVEIESVASAFPLIAHIFGVGQSIDYSAGFAKLGGEFPGRVGSILLSVEMIVLVVVWVFAFIRIRNGFGKPQRADRYVVLVGGTLFHLLAFQMSTLIYLPQYVLWLTPFACLLLPAIKAKTLWVFLWVAAAVYTLTVFPFNFSSVVNMTLWGIILVLLKNLTIVAIFVWVVSVLRGQRAAIATDGGVVDGV